jgi:hypothetical protein
VPGNPAQNSYPVVKTSALAAVVAARAQQQQANGKSLSAVPNPNPLAAPALTVNPLVSPVSLTAPPPPIPLRDWADRCEQATSTLRNSIVELSYYGYKLRAAADWGSLGFPTESSFVEHLGISSTQWQKYMVLGERIESLPLHLLRDLTVDIAERLALIHPRIWPEFPWLEEARALTGREFRVLVEQRNKDLAGVGGTGSGPTLLRPTTRLPFLLAEQHSKRMRRRVEALRKVEGLKSAVDVLDYALACAEEKDQLDARTQAAGELLAELGDVCAETVSAQESATAQLARYETGESPTASVLASVDRIRILVARLQETLTAAAAASEPANVE